MRSRRRLARRIAGTRSAASSTIEPVIFDSPTRRSRKTIGTSTTRNPARDRAVGGLDLEGVAERGDRLELDRLEHLAAKDLEAAGEVADPEPEHGARVGAAAAADQPPHRAPVGDRRRRRRSASRAPGRRRSAAASRRGRSAGSWEKSASIWATSSAPAGERDARSRRRRPGRGPPCAARCRTSTSSCSAREPVGDLAGAVGRGVVDDQHAPLGRQLLADARDDRLEVVGLVVGRQDEPDGRGRRLTRAI